jgi:hypothetical protein
MTELARINLDWRRGGIDNIGRLMGAATGH